ncbi:MAG: aminotransferase class I/II-fold pyridoxal phosphate-dependent enzyme [Chitinophagaceae bacterium]|nr:aminotransferase class I/II-fold pyridoxal phosphate-dependent enzyme [Chitinophagaceae bacterium]
MQIHSKLPSVGTTIFTVMSSLAVEHNAVNLGQGFPDFMMSEDLVAMVNATMQKGNNQYVHMNGLPLLRERIAEKCFNLYNNPINPETQITITPGGTYAIYTALTTVLQPNDEVIVFEPAYDSYIPNIEINGAKAIRISLQYPSYNIPWDEVRTNVNERTRMIMINSPHNPTGAVLGEDDIAQLRSIVANTNIIILSDEVYEHLIFDGMQHQSILRYPDLIKRSFVCFSFGKTYHCTGWKIGYCISSAEAMKEFRKVHQFNCFSVDSPKQFALAEYLQNEEAYLTLGPSIQAKRDYFRALMKDTPFKLIPSHGSYFECYSYEGVSDMNDKDFAIHLTKNYGVATIPVSAFYKDAEDNKVIRFCFAKKEETLQKAVSKLKAFQ